MYIATFLKQKIKDQVDVKIVDYSLGSWPYKKFEKIFYHTNQMLFV